MLSMVLPLTVPAALSEKYMPVRMSLMVLLAMVAPVTLALTKTPKLLPAVSQSTAV